MNGPTLVVGVGYLGRRFLEHEKTAFGLTRGDHDLDQDGPLPVELPESYTVLYTVPPSQESLSDVRLQRLLNVLDPAPTRFVYISTTGVYGDRGGATVSEETPTSPGSDRAARRVAAEDALNFWAAEKDCDAVVLRVPGIYGPGRLGIERLREGSPLIEESDAGPGNRIHVDDLLACCVAALQGGVPAGVYNVGDGDHRTSTWFANEVARQCKLPAPPTVSMEVAQREFSPMRMSFLGESRRVDTQKMRDVLGVTLKYANPEAGITASIQEEGHERGVRHRK
jgi:nucleoside-diphosphate-sugar epimerase